MNIWNKIVEAILSVPVDKRLHFGAGVLVAAFAVITLGAPLGVFFAAFAGVVKELVSMAISKTPLDPWDIGATAIGGAVISFFELLHVIF